MSNNKNLDTFMNMLILLIEKSDEHNKDQLKELKKMVDKRLIEIESNILKQGSELYEIKLNKRVDAKVSSYKLSKKSKFITAITTLIITLGMVLAKFKSEICDMLSNFFK